MAPANLLHNLSKVKRKYANGKCREITAVLYKDLECIESNKCIK